MFKFEWDATKAQTNITKHAVTFEEAASIFDTFNDPDHSAGEVRLLSLGLSRTGRLLMVSHAERGRKIRIISARLATRNERKIYEED